MVPFCETPEQSVAAGVVGGLIGGALGVTLGFGFVGAAVLAGAIGGLGDVGLHALRRDERFTEAVEGLRHSR